MNAELTRLGIPDDVQALFKIESPTFDYGDSKEVFRQNLHYVPSSRNLWIAGSPEASDILITRSAMECIAYLSLNFSRIKNPENLCFIAIGNRPVRTQMVWVAKRFAKRKTTLIFENDLIGRVTDIAIAAWLRNHHVQLQWNGNLVCVNHRLHSVAFAETDLGLNGFELAFGIRTGIRTRKSRYFPTYLDQLKHDNYK